MVNTAEFVFVHKIFFYLHSCWVAIFVNLYSMTPQVPEQVLQTLEALISSLIGQSSTFGTAVLTSEHLLKILDVFRGIRKVVLCKVTKTLFFLFSSNTF